MTPLRPLILATSLLIAATLPAWATNPPGGTCSGGGGPCGSQGSGGSSYPQSKSLEWGIKVGLARYPKPTTLSDFGQAAFEKNGNLPDFGQLFGRYFSDNPQQQMQINLELSQPQLSAATFHPSCLFVQSEALFEILKKPAAGDFSEFIHQILTDDVFTLVDVLPAPDRGWRLRVWKRDAASLNKSGGFYVTTEFLTKTPLNDVIFKRPNGSSGDDVLIYSQKETTGVGGTRTITHQIAQTLDANGKPATVTTNLYSGDSTAGPILSQENLTYIERGTKWWDYTIVREILTASVDAAGTIGALTLTSKTREDYDDYSTSTTGGELGMKRLVSSTEAYDFPGQSPQTTTSTYVQNPTNSTTHGRLESTLKPDGSWTYSEYSISTSSPVSITTEYSGWKDRSMAQRADARKTVTTVSANETVVEIFVSGQLIAKSKTTLGAIANDPFKTAEKWDGNSWHVTTTGYFSDSAVAPATGRIKWIENSDGTATTYGYATVNQNLVVTARSGAGSRLGITAGTQTLTTYGLGNFPIAEITTDIASNLTTERWDTDLTYHGGFDALGRPIKRIYNADVNDYDITQYACCGLEFSRDRLGATTQYFRDGLKRVYKTETQASAASPAVTDFTTVDGLTQNRSRSIGGQVLFLGSATRSLDGLTRTSISPARKSTLATDRPLTTTVTRHSATGDTVATTFADSSTSITATYLDGRAKSTTGSAVPEMSYDYATHSENGGGETTLTNASGVVTTQFSDLLARPSKTVSAATGTSISDYYPAAAAAGSRGKLKSMTDGDEVTTTYGYDAEGQPITIARSIPLADGSTATQVTTTARDVVANVLLQGRNLGISRRQTQTISATGLPTVTTSETFAATAGLISGSRSFGRETLSVQTRPDAAGVATTTATQPDGTKSLQIRSHGLVTAVQKLSTTGSIVTATTYTYDSLQRPTTSTDARTGTTTMSSLTESGQPLTVTSNSNVDVTTMGNDIMGRTIKTILPDSTIKYTAYHPTGQVKVTWGSQTYPTWNVYDEQGRQTQLHTWKTAPTLNPASIPANPPAGSEATTWIFSPTTGHLNRKQYADAKGTDYTYTAGGKLASRTWARTASGSQNRVTTTYSYTQGLLTLTDYSDATPDVATTYDGYGRQSTVTQANQSQIAYSYNSTNLTLASETTRYDLDHNGSYEFSRILDRSHDALLRDTGFILGSTPASGVGGGAPASTLVETQATYAYSATDGRVSQISNPQISNQTFTYDYLANSNLLEKITGPLHTVTNTYELNRDVLASKQNKLGTSVISQYDYSVNAIGQRTGVATSGSAFPALPSWLWSYDAFGQVIAADSRVATSDRAYQYDSIGNRQRAAAGTLDVNDPVATLYAASVLNQYSQITSNAITSTLVHDADGNATVYPGETTSQLVPQGEQRTVLEKSFSWNAENQMVFSKSCSKSQIISPVVPGVPAPINPVAIGSDTAQTYYFYDSLGRRIAKKSGTTDNGMTIYIYDGWNCIAEYTQHSEGNFLKITRLWGIDLSDSLQGAGGVGGMLSESSLITSNPITFNSFYPTYDGNGNVSEYLSANGSIAAHFEYDPFGNTVVNTDTGNLFAYRFSTKPIAFATGLYYYGYRYYDPLTGRWPSRDPIGEMGGDNLYAFVINDSVNWVDYLGWNKTCFKEVTMTHFGDLGSDSVGTRNNKLRKGDIAVGHNGKTQHPKKGDSWVLPFGAKVRVYPNNSPSFNGKVSDVGAYDKKHPEYTPEDWIDIWDPEKSKKQKSDKGCLETDVDLKCPCPQGYKEGKCPNKK